MRAWACCRLSVYWRRNISWLIRRCKTRYQYECVCMCARVCVLRECICFSSVSACIHVCIYHVYLQIVRLCICGWGACEYASTVSTSVCKFPFPTYRHVQNLTLPPLPPSPKMEKSASRLKHILLKKYKITEDIWSLTLYFLSHSHINPNICQRNVRYNRTRSPI